MTQRIYGWEKPSLLRRLGVPAQATTRASTGVTRSRPATEQERLDHEANLRAQRKATTTSPTA